jgi:hypothetical protein
MRLLHFSISFIKGGRRRIPMQILSPLGSADTNFN